MPQLTSIPFPNAVGTLMDLLTGITINGETADVRLAVPPDHQGEAIYVVKRVGGTPDIEDVTDFPIMMVASYGKNYQTALDFHDAAEIRILSSPCTEIKHSPSDPFGVLVDEASIYVGEQEIPDLYPDERRIVSTYRLGWRRQFRP